MFTRRRTSTTYTVTTYRLHVVEETDESPSLPPMPVVETTIDIETTRPVRQCRASVSTTAWKVG